MRLFGKIRVWLTEALRTRPEPELVGRGPCWEVWIGEHGDRNRFLLDILDSVPPGSTLWVSSPLTPEQRAELGRLTDESDRHGIAVVVTEESLPVIQSVAAQADLRRQWHHMHICQGEKVYLQSHDWLTDLWIAAGFEEAKLQAWKQAGIIKGYEWAEPGA